MSDKEQILALRTAANARVHRVTDWFGLAMRLYRKMYGRRCAECSQIVEETEAALFTMEGIDEIILVHERCIDGPAQTKQAAVLETAG